MRTVRERMGSVRHLPKNVGGKDDLRESQVQIEWFVHCLVQFLDTHTHMHTHTNTHTHANTNTYT